MAVCMLGNVSPAFAQGKPFGEELPFSADPFAPSKPLSGSGRDGEKSPPPPPPMPIDDHLWAILIGGFAVMGYYFLKNKDQKQLS